MYNDLGGRRVRANLARPSSWRERGRSRSKFKISNDTTLGTFSRVIPESKSGQVHITNLRVYGFSVEYERLFISLMFIAFWVNLHLYGSL